MKKILLPLALSLTVVACGSKAPTAPTPPPAPTPPVVPACESNQTSQVRFGNRSPATTYTVFWDGLNVATIAPGQDSDVRTVAAGVAHRLEFRIANTSLLACAVGNPIPIQCNSHTYTCAFPS